MAREQDSEALVLQAVEAVNASQKKVLVNKIVQRFGEDLSGKSFAIWGLAFKPQTDDMREAPSIVIIQELLARGASVQAYDPVAMSEAKKAFGAKVAISYATNEYDALKGASALLLVTEWHQFRYPDFSRIKQNLQSPIIFDGRNQYDPCQMRELGFEYYSIGRV